MNNRLGLKSPADNDEAMITPQQIVVLNEVITQLKSQAEQNHDNVPNESYDDKEDTSENNDEMIDINDVEPDMPAEVNNQEEHNNFKASEPGPQQDLVSSNQK